MTTIIIGGGASGLACAIRLKQNKPNEEVIVLERLNQTGKKILATGNGRCNLSNTDAEHYEEVIDFFNSLGLVTRSDSEGRIYPYSNQAQTVLQILNDSCESLGVKIITECTVKSIDSNLCVTSDNGTFFADNVVIAAGGKAQKALGSDGSGYQLLENLGHTITPLSPALVQLKSSSKYPRALKGHRIKCNMKILLDNKNVCEEFGEILFTDYGLSGIVTMNLSQAVSCNFSSDNPKKCHAVLDLIPDMTTDELIQYLKQYKSLKGVLGEKISSIIDKQAQGNIINIAEFAKNWKFIITGTKGFDFAQITAGGAVLEEFSNFESKRVKGLYACGEILDKQFKCGGYNLNFAWYSGIKTADQIAGVK